jgi:hypothetical protein
MKTVYNLDFGEIHLYPNYIVSYINSGTIINMEKFNYLATIAGKHYANKDFAYISIRKNSYSIDPNIYRMLIQIENLKAFAVVQPKNKRSNFHLEKYFYQGNMESFCSYYTALRWINNNLQLQLCENNHII